MEERRKKKLEQVKLIKKVIKSRLLSDGQVTQFCQWLGFNDTSFRDKTQGQKLKDYLLDEQYWMSRDMEFGENICKLERKK